MPLRLALSLHAPEDALRTEIMPVNAKHPIAEVLDACDEWYAKRRRKVFVEYLMLEGVNDTVGQARQLARAARPDALQGQPDPVQPDGRRLRGLRPRPPSPPSRPSSRSTATPPPSA